MEDLIKEIESLGSASIHAFGGSYVGGILLHQIPKEIAQCIHYLMEGDKPVRSYLEIGAAAGGTAYIFDRFFDIEKMVLIDLNDRGRKSEECRRATLENVNYSEFIGYSQSKEAIEFVRNLNRTFDVVFIDGDHTYEGVSADVINYSKFVSPGGYLIMHDIWETCPGVKIVFDGIKNSGNFASVVEFIDHDHWQPCGIGVIKRHG